MWPLWILWAAALAYLTFVQSWRIDADCADCPRYYQLWYDGLSWLGVALLTILVFQLGRVVPNGERRAAILGRSVALIGVTTVYLLTRLWMQWDNVAVMVANDDFGKAASWLFVSNDSYSLAITTHLALAASILLIVGHAKPEEYYREVENVARGAERQTPFWVEIRDELLMATEIFCRGVSLCLATAGLIMLLGPLIQKLISPGFPVPLSATLLSAIISLAGILGYRLPAGKWGRPVVLAIWGLTLAFVVGGLVFFQRLQLAYVTLAGFNPSNEEVRYKVGLAMMIEPRSFFQEALLSRAWDGFAYDAVLITLIVVLLASSRMMAGAHAR